MSLETIHSWADIPTLPSILNQKKRLSGTIESLRLDLLVNSVGRIEALRGLWRGIW